MKRSLIALGVATALVAPLANAKPKVYGKLNLSLEQISDDTKADSRWEVLSNASRFGVKGEDELSPSLSAVYQIEWGVSGEGDATDMEQRNRFVGIKSVDFGTLKLGKYDTYLKLAQAEIDQFNDLNADMGKVFAGENRVNNVIGYESPKIADAIVINLAVMPGQEVQDKAANNANCTGTVANEAKCDNNGIADAISTSVVYSNEEAGIYAAIAYDKGVVSTFNGLASGAWGTAPAIANAKGGGTLDKDQTDIIRLVGSYNLKDIGLTLSALYQQAKRSETARINSVDDVKPEETGYLLSAAYKIDEAWTAKLQYAASSVDLAKANLKDVDMTQTSLGVDYNFASKTKAFAYYSVRNTSNDNNSDAATNGKTKDFDVSFLGLGIEHKF